MMAAKRCVTTTHEHHGNIGCYLGSAYWPGSIIGNALSVCAHGDVELDTQFETNARLLC